MFLSIESKSTISHSKYIKKLARDFQISENYPECVATLTMFLNLNSENKLTSFFCNEFAQRQKKKKQFSLKRCFKYELVN